MKYYRHLLISIILLVSLFSCACANNNFSTDSSKESADLYDRDLSFNYTTDITKNYSVVNNIDNGWNIVNYTECGSFSKELNSQNSNYFLSAFEDYYAILNESYFLNNNNELNYKFSLFTKTGEKVTNIKSIYDMDLPSNEDKSLRIKELFNKALNGHAIVTSIDYKNNNVYLFFNDLDEDFLINDFVCLVIENNGIIKDFFSLGEFIGEKSSKQDNDNHNHNHDCDHEHEITRLYYATFTQENGIVLWNNFSNTVTCISSDMKLINKETINDCPEDAISFSGKTSDGIPVFEYVDLNSNVTLFLVTNEFKKITSGRIDSAECRYLSENGFIYYISGNSLFCWDVSKGSCEKIYVFDGIDYCSCKNIHMNSDGDIDVMFYDYFESKLFDYTLSVNKNVDRTDLVVYKYSFDEYIDDCAADFARMNPSINVIVRTMEEDSKSLTVLADEIKSGQGPDIIIANRAMLETLQHVGIADDLNNYIDKIILDELFAGILNYGTIDGKLYGIPFDASIYTLVGIKGLSDKEDWNIKSLMSDFESIKESNPNIRLMAVPEYPMTVNELLLILGTVGLDYSDFVDFDRNECYFDSNEFIDFLKFIKENAESDNAPYLSEEEVYSLLKNKQAMLTIVEGGFVGFSSKMSALYNSCDILGLPLRKGTNIITCYSCLSINSFSDKKELIKEFIETVLSENCQVKYSVNHVRKDVLLNHVYEHTDITPEPIILIGGHNIIPLGGKSDNSSFLKEYIETIDTALPATIEYEIQSIIIEEASAFFDGTKSAEEVAKLIQSRVQLYLEERK
ncbi:MAG: extracellular solute-binding protein [Lachnospiraceae bacterium]|nr:extracellular solute-binding protein [Lachnospiraceae bacterium]